MNDQAVIFGAGGHAGVIASLIHSRYHRILFITPEPTNNSLDEATFFASDSHQRDSDVYIGIGNNEVRKQIFDRLAKLNIAPANCIADTAFVAADARLGKGVVICPGSVVMSKAQVGDNVIINTLSSVDHDCIVGNHTQITAGVIFGGNTRVGQSCFFGVRSATIPGVTIGGHTIVMAGSLVTKDLPDNVMAGGYPAILIKTNN